MKKQNRKIILTKKALRDALIELLNERHLTEVTVSLLCEKADINRSTFYNHYTSVLALLDELEEENITYFEEVILKLNKSNNNFDGKLILESLFKHLQTNASFFKIVLTNQNYGTFLDKLINAVYFKVDDRFPISLKKTPEKFVYVIHGSIALVRLWFDLDFHKTPKQMASLILENANTIINK